MRWRVLLALAAVLITAWMLGTFRLQSFHQSGAHSYDFDFQGAQWIQASPPGPRSYFRFDFTLPAVPDNVVLWLDASQGFTAYANGKSVGSDTSSVKSGLQARAVPLDITRHLVVGANAVAVEVTNSDGGAAALRARLSILTGGVRSTVTSSPRWRATSDVSQVKPRLSLHAPQFSTPIYNDGNWQPAQPVSPVRTAVQASVPAAVVEQPLTAEVLGPPHAGTEMLASVALDLPAAPQDGWFRVAASGPYSIFVDGDLLTSQSSVVVPTAIGQGAPLTRLSLFNIGPYLHQGTNIIAAHVSADPLAALYLDGAVQTSAGTTTLATDSHWGVSAPPFGDALHRPSVQRGLFLGSAKVAFPQGVVEKIAGVTQVNIPGGLVLSNRLLTIGGLLLLWVVAGGAIALGGTTSMSRALVVDGAAHLPAIAAIGATEQLARLHDVTPPFPHVPWVLAALVGFLLICKLATGLVATRAVGAVSARVRSWRAERAPRPELSDRLALALAEVRHKWNVVAIVGIGAICGGFTAYRLDYEPYWQDELASLYAARGVRSHLIPELPSTFVYWKGELYSGVIAAIGAVTHDDIASLRFLSVFWYVATVLAFGLLLVPMILPRRPFIQVLLTLFFATAPAELAWARDVRMYQQAQFFAVIFIVLFFKAMQRPQLRTIAGSAAALVLMYLSHEETFIYLPVIPIVFFAVMRLRWVRDWRWWAFGGGAAALIAGQYLLTQLTHPPSFGYDHSNKPYIGWDTHNFWYYFTKVYFPVTSRDASLGLVSTLAVIAGIVGVWRRSLIRLYFSAFLWIPVIALSTVFTPKVPRYVFITLPLLFLLAGVGALDVLSGIRWFVSGATGRLHDRRVGRLVTALVAIPTMAWLALSVTGGLRDYGVAVARLTGATMSHKHVDYNYVARYITAHQRPGDLLLTLAPPNLAAYYVGRSPDMIIATGRDKLLYLMEKNGRAVDTNFGAPVILTRDDLQHVLDAHHRIWLVTDQGNYLHSVDSSITNLVLDDFDLVSEGETAAVYFRGD